MSEARYFIASTEAWSILTKQHVTLNCRLFSIPLARLIPKLLSSAAAQAFEWPGGIRVPEL